MSELEGIESDALVMHAEFAGVPCCTRACVPPFGEGTARSGVELSPCDALPQGEHLLVVNQIAVL